MKPTLFKIAIWVLRRAYKFVDYPWDRWILAAVDTLEFYYGKRPELEEIRSKIKGVRK